MRPFFVGIEKKLFGDNFMTQPVDKAYIAGVALGTSLTLVPGYAFAEMGLNINGVNWYTPKSDSSEMTPEQKELSDRVTNNIFHTADSNEIIADTTTGKYAAPTETAKWSLGKKIFWTVFGVAVVSSAAYLYSNNQHKKRNKRTTDTPNTTSNNPPPIGGDPPPSGGGGGGGGGGDL